MTKLKITPKCVLDSNTGVERWKDLPFPHVGSHKSFKKKQNKKQTKKQKKTGR